MIVDAHAHSVSAKHFSEAFKRSMPMGEVDMDMFMSHMDAAGVEKIALLAQDMSRIWQSKITNGFVARMVRRFPDRLIGIAAAEPLDSQDRFNARELDAFVEAVRDLGLKGLLLTPPYGHYAANDRRSYPFYQKAVELGVPVYFHQSAQKGPSVLAPLRFAQPAIIDDIAIDFPELRINVEHMGYPWTQELLALMAHAPNVYSDVSALVERPTVLAWNLVMAKEYGVIDRVMYGSDYWYAEDQRVWEGTVKRSISWLRSDLNEIARKSGWPEFTDGEIEGILGTNAVRFLQI